MKFSAKMVYLILVAILTLAHNPANWVRAAGPQNFANCRLGVGGAFDNVIGFDMAQLNMGLYVDWRTSSNPYDPNGLGLANQIEYLQMVRVKQKKNGGSLGPPGDYVVPAAYNVSPSLDTITTIASGQPGALWLIGNEIERVDWYRDWLDSWTGQDEITPELYATAFHEIQAAIKAADPTARVAIGGVILGTPLRLKYLDRVWNSYQDQFGYSMGQDIDVWNVHGFILPEVRGAWGMDIPAGLETPADYQPEEGLFYFRGYGGDPSVPNNNVAYFEARDHQYDVDLFMKYIRDFRTWMAAKGERNKPLLNTEYGPLNDFSGYYDEQDAITFMHETFDEMLAAQDSATGYPYDDNKLVQGWVWYSLDAEWFPLGQLFKRNSKNLTTVGNGWKNYVTNPSKPLASQPQVNLIAADFRINQPVYKDTATLLTAVVSNSGNTATATNNNIVVKFWDGHPSSAGSKLIGSRIVGDIRGCGQYRMATVAWTPDQAGTYSLYVEVVPLSGEAKTGDNISSSSVTVKPEPSATPPPTSTPEPGPSPGSTYLPLIRK